eukprot:376732-Hanusia_phi.AAC.1
MEDSTGGAITGMQAAAMGEPTVGAKPGPGGAGATDATDFSAVVRASKGLVQLIPIEQVKKDRLEAFSQFISLLGRLFELQGYLIDSLRNNASAQELEGRMTDIGSTSSMLENLLNKHSQHDKPEPGDMIQYENVVGGAVLAGISWLYSDDPSYELTSAIYSLPFLVKKNKFDEMPPPAPEALKSLRDLLCAWRDFAKLSFPEGLELQRRMQAEVKVAQLHAADD